MLTTFGDFTRGRQSRTTRVIGKNSRNGGVLKRAKAVAMYPEIAETVGGCL